MPGNGNGGRQTKFNSNLFEIFADHRQPKMNVVRRYFWAVLEFDGLSVVPFPVVGLGDLLVFSSDDGDVGAVLGELESEPGGKVEEE